MRHSGAQLFRLLPDRHPDGQSRVGGGGCDQGWKNKSCDVEWSIMELNKRIKSSKESGTSLIELMIACLVLMIGVMGVVSLIPIAIAENGRNRQQSNSTVIAQMVMEKLLSVPAGTTTILTISDCTPTAVSVVTGGG